HRAVLQGQMHAYGLTYSVGKTFPRCGNGHDRGALDVDVCLDPLAEIAHRYDRSCQSALVLRHKPYIFGTDRKISSIASDAHAEAWETATEQFPIAAQREKVRCAHE